MITGFFWRGYVGQDWQMIGIGIHAHMVKICKNAQREAATLPVSKNNIYQLTLKVKRVACKFDAHSFIVECMF
jgi:hypothetical protein